MPLLIPSRSSKNGYDLKAWSHGEFHLEELDIRGTYDLINNTTYFIQSGFANAFAISGLVPAELPDLAFVPLQPAYELPAYVIWKKYRLQSRASEFFLKALRSEVEKETSTPTDVR